MLTHSINIYIRLRFALFFIVTLNILLSSCEKYLDVKPNKRMVTPSSLEDIQALLDNASSVMNVSEPNSAQICSDDYYLHNSSISSINTLELRTYTWDDDASIISNWSNPYKVINYANVALDNLSNIEPDNSNLFQWNNLKGQALFFRAWQYLNLTQIYTPPYSNSTSNSEYGLPLRLTSGIDETSTRSTLQKTYDQILSDLHEASLLMPSDNANTIRPSKVASFAALARAFLIMEDYSNALKFADSALKQYSSLIDFNSIDTINEFPFEAFNNLEIIFYTTSYADIFYNEFSRADSNLVLLYGDDDLRRSVFYRYNPGDNTHAYKTALYDGFGYGTFFNGLATDELYLIKSECLARLNEHVNAMKTLNTLLNKRWKNGTFTELQANSADEALEIVLRERRKELVMRGVRWSDLRRLNKDPKYATTLKRNLSGQEVILAPDDKRYTMIIPPEVISITGMKQNAR